MSESHLIVALASASIVGALQWQRVRREDRSVIAWVAAGVASAWVCVWLRCGELN